jgi:hypothetical protein
MDIPKPGAVKVGFWLDGSGLLAPAGVGGDCRRCGDGEEDGESVPGLGSRRCRVQ